MTEHVSDDVRKVAELAKGIKIGMLTTIDADGQPVSRPMAQQEVEFDGDLWFFVERGSRKVAQIEADPRVNVTLASGSTWMSLRGTGHVVSDLAKARELWNPWVEAWMPQGPQDPSVALLKVSVEGAEYWDTPGGKVASVISFVKAKVSGQRYDGGDHDTVDL
jgi:general stress protein 26